MSVCRDAPCCTCATASSSGPVPPCRSSREGGRKGGREGGREGGRDEGGNKKVNPSQGPPPAASDCRTPSPRPCMDVDAPIDGQTTRRKPPPLLRAFSPSSILPPFLPPSFPFLNRPHPHLQIPQRLLRQEQFRHRQLQHLLLDADSSHVDDSRLPIMRSLCTMEGTGQAGRFPVAWPQQSVVLETRGACSSPSPPLPPFLWTQEAAPELQQPYKSRRLHTLDPLILVVFACLVPGGRTWTVYLPTCTQIPAFAYLFLLFLLSPLPCCKYYAPTSAEIGRLSLFSASLRQSGTPILAASS